MATSAHPRPNATGTGHINSFNQTYTNNTTTNITYVNKRTKLLNWLSPLQPRVRHNDVRSRRQEGLGEWFVQADEFLRWRDGEGELGGATLFCSGNPGVGKTFLSSVVIDRLLDYCVGKNATVACLYCDFQDHEKQTAASMLGALTKQLVNALEMVPTEIEKAFERAEREVGGRGLQVSEISKLLQVALAPAEQTFICIDAVDECADKHLPQLLATLHTISQASPGVRLFITGRCHIGSVVERHLPGSVHAIPISPHREDIREYLERELKDDMNSEAMNPALREEIIKHIPERIPDAFLLVSLSIASILAEATIYKRRERLNGMASGLGLDSAYDATLNRIKGLGKGNSELGMAALMWISCSERPMHIGELCGALGVEIGSRDIESENIPREKTLLASCLGLVTVDETSIVHLVHFTLQEYFNKHSDHFQNPQSTMAEVSLTYLNFDSINKLPYTLNSAPVEARFLQYASRYWGLHARHGLAEAGKLLAFQLLGKFGGHISAKLFLMGYFDSWEPRRTHSERFTGLHYAACLGLNEIAICLLEGMEGCGADMVDHRGLTPLRWAVESGHEGMVKLLLGREEVNPDSRDNAGQTPLEWAAYKGHEEVVKLLLGRAEVNPDRRNNHGQTPLWWAASSGHEGIVKLLLDRKEVNPDSRGNDGRTPLGCAAFDGHEGVVKLLLDRAEVNPDSRDNYGQTPLRYAASGGHEGIVKLLLDRAEVNPDWRNKRGETPLSRAASSGHEGVVKLLLDRKEVNPDSRDNYGQTPLWRAAFGGYEGIVKLLLDRKEVNPDSRDHNSQTPLWWAARGGHEGMVKLLLDREVVNPDSRDKYGQTPLRCAASGGHEGIVKLLLDREEVNPDSRDNNSQTPLWWAARGGHEGIVKLLLDREEVNPDSRDNSGETPLICATQRGHHVITELLKGRLDAEPDKKANHALTPPSHLAEDNNDTLVVAQLPPQPLAVTLDLLTQNLPTPLRLAIPPTDTPDASSEISSHAPLPNSRPSPLSNPVPRTALALATIAIIAAILALAVGWWLQSHGSFH